MPSRRPSGPPSSHSIPSSTRMHKSNDSNTFVGSSTHPQSVLSLGSTAAPQQKIVQVLVNRLKNKLPCYSGVSLEVLESDNATQQAIEALVDLSHDSLDIIAWALSELLERLAKQTDAQGYLSIEVLQSQLVILKVLSVAMASRWNQNARSNSRASNRPYPDSPNAFDASKRNRQGSSEYSSTPPPWTEPPPLDDNCARYILSVMVLFLRQTALPETPLLLSSRSADPSFKDLDTLKPLTLSPVQEAFRGSAPVPQSLSKLPEPALKSIPSSNSIKSKNSVCSTIPISVHNMSYEKTHMTLVNSSLSINILINKFTGRIVYHLSASNWKVVFNRLRNKIHFLASNTEEKPDTVDLYLMTHCALDKQRLILLLNELSSLLVNMKFECQLAFAVPLRIAVWNWIDLFPAEFNDVVRTRGLMEGSPERVFDLLRSLNSTGNERILWPSLIALNCIAVDRLSSDYSVPQKHQLKKDSRFAEDIIKNCSSTSSKIAEVAFVCALDFCRAAAFVRPDGEVSLRMMAFDAAHEIKSLLWKSQAHKPFWELNDEIDVTMHSEALVAIFRFLPEVDCLPLFKICIEPERSEAVKTCAVRACLTLMVDAPRLPWQKSLESLEKAFAPRLRSIYKTLAGRRNEVDQYGNIKRAAPRPKSRRTASQTHSDRELLLLGILSLWRSNPAFFFHDMDAAEIDDWIFAAIKLFESEVDNSVKISAANSLQLMAEISFAMSPQDPHYNLVVPWMKTAFAATVVSVSTNLIHTRTDVESQRMWIGLGYQFLELHLRKTDVEHVKGIQLAPTRLPAFALAEIAFLISLTSVDIHVSQAAAKGLRLLAQAERQEGAPIDPNVNEEDKSKCNPIYEQLGDPKVMFVGRVGHQKRIRKLVRLIAYPASNYIAVWEECYWRWRQLTEIIIESMSELQDSPPSHRSDGSMLSQEKHHQWQNLTLFLAAFGGVCVEDEQDLPPLAAIIPLQYLPDEMRVLQNPSTLVGTFITELTNLLVVPDYMKIREVARDALGSELSPRLFSRLLKHLDYVVRDITKGAGSELTETYTLFLDQFIAVLKLLVENAQLAVEEVLTVDISSTLLAIALFITRFSVAASSRIRTKFCVLCETVCDRAEILSLRKDNDSRHKILDNVMEWIQDHPNDATPEQIVAQNELNISCLRATVRLLDHLQLQPLDGSSGDDSVHVVSRLFSRYSKNLLKGLDICQLGASTPDNMSDTLSIQHRNRVLQRDDELRELVITGLAHLVSANTESGFKHCLPLAYDKEPRKRTIFAHVFARVLGQGTTFDSQDRGASSARHARLAELIKGSDMCLAMAICEICPPAEVDIITSVLLNMFDSRESLMGLMKLMIDREVAHSENEAALFRGNSTTTRFLSAFAKIHGYNYLRSLIKPLVKTMSSIPPGQNYELDPAKAGDQDVGQNQRNIELVASSFLNIVSSSIDTLPSMFREICAHIAKAVSEVWPDSKFAAVGAFIFLRFISPAMVSPEIVDVDLPKDDGLVIRRGLMVMAKIIQNLANNIFFGKEAFMIPLNRFLETNIVVMTRYLSEVKKYSPSSSEIGGDEWLGGTSDDTDVIVLHRFFEKHGDKIGKELLSQSKPVADGETPAISGKRSWDALCNLLVDMGTPLEVPRLSNHARAAHREYNDLMVRYAHRSTDAVQQIFVQTEAIFRNGPAVFVLRTSKINVEDLDMSLLMFHIFKTLALPVYDGREFEVIVDCTSFTSMSEVPLQWLKYCVELIPSDIRQRFMVTRILNPNALAQRYLRRLYNISAGVSFCGEIKAYSSVNELLQQAPSRSLVPLSYTMNLEDEPNQSYSNVTMRQINHIRAPVILQVGASHLRITTIKAQSISPILACKSVEIIPLVDVSDVYNVSIGQEANEFIIRRSRQGVTLYFSSSERDSIVKTIRAAKGQLKETHTPLSERFSRFSNVPATLLHVGMLDLLSVDVDGEELRGAAYDLLGAVCSSLKYDKSPIVASTTGLIPGDSVAFVVQLSERLSEFAPELTLDFISEVSAGMDAMESAPAAQRINCLQYMNPWIKNLAYFSNPIHPLYDRSGARLRDCIRTLADLSIKDPEITPMTQKYVWTELGKLDSSLINVILDELIRTATDAHVGSQRSETMARIVASLSSINVRGRLFSKLRKSLGKSSNRSFNSLENSPQWNEIATLVRFALVAAYQSKQPSHNQLYVPEIAHLVTLLAGIGVTLVRKSVYGIVINLLQSLYVARGEDDAEPELLLLINQCTLPETLCLFGLQRTTPTSEYTSIGPINDKSHIDNVEGLTKLLDRILEATAGSRGLLNVWRARWMSLVTSTAFQLSLSVQSRSFLVLGTLASSDVDDDFMYQMFVAFKSALSQSTETETLTVISMLRCMCSITPALPDDSKWIFPMFWLAVALLQSSHLAFYIDAANLLRISLETLDSRGTFEHVSVATVLLEARSPIDDVASQLDHVLGLSFDSSFSFSLASIIFKGLRHSGLKDAAGSVLRSLLCVTIDSYKDEDALDDSLPNDVLGYFIALLPLSTTPATYRQLLENCNLAEFWLPESAQDDDERGVPRIPLAMIGVNDSNTALFVASFVGAMLTTAQGDDAETQILYTLLSDVATLFPETVSMTYEGLQDRIKDTFANSSNAAIIKAVSNIFRVALQDAPRVGVLRGSASTLSTVDENSSHGPGRNHLLALEDLGMQGLASSFLFLPLKGGHATKMIHFISDLVLRIIE